MRGSNARKFAAAAALAALLAASVPQGAEAHGRRWYERQAQIQAQQAQAQQQQQQQQQQAAPAPAVVAPAPSSGPPATVGDIAQPAPAPPAPPTADVQEVPAAAAAAGSSSPSVPANPAPPAAEEEKKAAEPVIVPAAAAAAAPAAEAKPVEGAKPKAAPAPAQAPAAAPVARVPAVNAVVHLGGAGAAGPGASVPADKSAAVAAAVADVLKVPVDAVSVQGGGSAAGRRRLHQTAGLSVSTASSLYGRRRAGGSGADGMQAAGDGSLPIDDVKVTVSAPPGQAADLAARLRDAAANGELAKALRKHGLDVPLPDGAKGGSGAKKLGPGPIAGIAVGSLAGLFLLGGLLWALLTCACCAGGAAASAERRERRERARAEKAEAAAAAAAAAGGAAAVGGGWWPFKARSGAVADEGAALEGAEQGLGGKAEEKAAKAAAAAEAKAAKATAAAEARAAKAAAKEAAALQAAAAKAEAAAAKAAAAEEAKAAKAAAKDARAAAAATAAATAAASVPAAAAAAAVAQASTADDRVASTAQMLREYASELAAPLPAGATSPRGAVGGRAASTVAGLTTARAHIPPPPPAAAPTLTAGELSSRLAGASEGLAAYTAGLSVKTAAPLVASVLASARARRAAGAAPEPGSEDEVALHAIARSLLDNPKFAGGRYVVEGAAIASATSVAAPARGPGGAPAELLFYADPAEFASARRFLAQARNPEFVPALLDVYEAGKAPLVGLDGSAAAAGSVLKATGALAVERGRQTLAEWLASEKCPPAPAQKAALVNVLEALAYLHGRQVVHRDVRPGAVRWAEGAGRWRLGLPVGAWARAGHPGPLTYSLRHAAPELVAADARAAGERLAAGGGAAPRSLAVAEAPASAVADPASDVWAAGVLAWELMTGAPLFGANYSDEQVAAMLLGFRKLPFEADPSLWVGFRDARAAALVKTLLARAPADRPSAAAALREAVRYVAGS